MTLNGTFCHLMTIKSALSPLLCTFLICSSSSGSVLPILSDLLLRIQRVLMPFRDTFCHVAMIKLALSRCLCTFLCVFRRRNKCCQFLAIFLVRSSQRVLMPLSDTFCHLATTKSSLSPFLPIFLRVLLQIFGIWRFSGIFRKESASL